MESEDTVPVADSGNNGPGDGSVIPESLPLPPPPPLPPNPAATNPDISLPPPPLPPPPPPPPGPLPTETISNRPLHPPPPPHQQLAQPLPPGISGNEKEQNQSTLSDQLTSKDSTQVSFSLLSTERYLHIKRNKNYWMILVIANYGSCLYILDW